MHVIKEETMVIGHTYNGAANTAGVKNLVQTLIQKDWPYAKFVVKSACKDV